MTEPLIPQYFHAYSSYKDFQESRPIDTDIYGRSRKLIYENLLDIGAVFIVAEPGYGKTTAMNHLKKQLESKKIKYHYQNGLSLVDHISTKKGIKYFLLDALDESKEVVSTFLKVRNYCDDKGIRLIITNRSHYLAMIAHLLENQDFTFIELQAFDDYQIKSYLSQSLDPNDFKEESIDQIILKTKTNSYKSILSVPRYLSELSKYINTHKITSLSLTQLNKSELFEKIFYYKLDHEATSKQNANQKYLTKRVLERLSLVMEIHSLNQITKEDFITFLDQTDSNISLIFLNAIDLDELLNRVLKSTGEYLQFENTEFQEYLAAKEIVRLGNRFQTIYDLMVQKETGILPSNWIDVLNFTIDLDPEFVRPIISFIRKRKYEAIDQKLIEILMSVPREQFENDFCDLFFNTIFEYYSAKGKIIYQTYEPLSNFISLDNTDILEPLYSLSTLSDPVRHIQSNQILLIEALARKSRLSNSDILRWITYLIELVKKDELYSMHNTAFHALIALGNPVPMFSLINEFEKKEDYLLNNLISALTKISPNEPNLVKLVSRCLKKPRRLDNLDTAIDNFSTEKAVSDVLNMFIKYPESLQYENFRYGIRFYRIFESIAGLHNQKVDALVQKLLLKLLAIDRYASYMPQFLEKALIYVLSKRPKIIIKIVALESFHRSAADITERIVLHIELDTFKTIENALIDSQNSWRLRETIHKVIYRLENNQKSNIYQYIDDKYLKPWANEQKETYVKPEEPTPIEKLRTYFVEEDGFFIPALIPHFVSHFDVISPYLEESDKDYLVKVIHTQLENYKPDEFTLNTKEESATRTSIFHNHEIWFGIENYFKAAFLLSKNDILIQYREKLLKTIPRVDVYETASVAKLKELIKVIEPLSEDDVKMLHDFCMGRTDDLLVLSSKSIATVALSLNLRELNPVLLMLIKNPKVKTFEKEEIIKIFSQLAIGDDDKKSLIKLFQNERLKIKDLANSALVSTYKDKKAIKWRFKELKSRMQEFDFEHKYNGTRSVSTFEMELERPEFGNCFYGIKNSEIYYGMLDLLTFSFELRTKKKQFAYSTYLQKIIQQYFRTIISEKVLNDLRATISKFHTPEQTFSFNEHLDELLVDHFNKYKRPEPFIEAVKGLNQILSRAYLPINSHYELKEKILKIINEDIKRLIEDDGLYRLSEEINSRSVNESIIQKTLKIALEKALLEHGLRKSDIHREVESLAGLKHDYLINYGLFGPIMVELKLLHNPEVQSPSKRVDYKKKMMKYMGANNQMGIYLIFQTHNSETQLANYNRMLKEYSNLKDLNIQIIKCFDQQATIPIEKPTTKRKK